MDATALGCVLFLSIHAPQTASITTKKGNPLPPNTATSKQQASHKRAASKQQASNKQTASERQVPKRHATE